jgi:hypothetical protein
MADLTPEQQQALEAFENSAEALEKLGVQVNRFSRTSLKSIEQRFKDIDKTVKKSDGSYKDAITQLDALKDAIEDDVDGIQTAKQKRQNLDRLEEIARKAYNETLTNAGKQLIGTVIGGFANYYVNQLRTGIRGLMGTSSPFQLATDLQVQMYEDVNKTLQGVAAGAETAGATLMALPLPAAKVAGGLLLLGGALTSFVAGKTTEYFQEKTRILGDAVEKTYNSFMQAAAAGALYAGGVTELRQIALQSGLTQEQFTKVIADNRQQLAEAGYSITEGTRIVGKVTQKFATDVGKSGQTLQREMLNLGYSVDEQASLAAETIANLRRMGGDPNNLREVGEATADYAKNLRLIAELTGDDAKKRMDAAKQVTDEYSFQRKFLREHNNDYKALQDAQLALGKYTLSEQKSIQQAYVRGTVTDVPSIIAGFKDPALKIADVLHQTKFNLSDMDDIVARYNDNLLSENDGRKEAIAASTVIAGKNSEMSKVITDNYNGAIKFNTDSLGRARQELDKAAGTPDDFTGSLNKSVIALQDMRNKIQTDLTGAIMKFADGVPKILADFRKKLVDVGILSGVYNNEKDRNATSTDQMYSKATTGKTAGGEDVGFFESWFNVVGASNPMGNVPIYTPGLDNKGKAKGGISDGPLGGYSEILHGREAVVPLPNGDKIPVEFKNTSGANDKSMQDLMSEIRNGNQMNSTKLEAILTAMQQNNKLTSGILQHSM